MFSVRMVVKGSEDSFPKYVQRYWIQISFHRDHQSDSWGGTERGIMLFMSLDFSQEKLKYLCFSPWKQVQISHSFTTHSQIHVKKRCPSTLRSHSSWFRRGEAQQKESSLYAAWEGKDSYHICTVSSLFRPTVSSFTDGIQAWAKEQPDAWTFIWKLVWEFAQWRWHMHPGMNWEQEVRIWDSAETCL